MKREIWVGGGIFAVLMKDKIHVIMVDATLVLTFFLAYKAFKKYTLRGLERPQLEKWTHLQVFVALGHICFVLGQHFLLTANQNLILGKDTVFGLVLACLVVSDIQDALYRKKPLWLYPAILLEYTLWSTVGLVAFLSARNGEGILLFVGSLSRIVDLLVLAKASSQKKL